MCENCYINTIVQAVPKRYDVILWLLGCVEKFLSWLIDYCIYNKQGDGKTKLYHVEDMLSVSVEVRKVAFSTMLMEAWYAAKHLLVFIESLEKTYYCPMQSNRLVDDSGDEKPYQRIDSLQWTPMYRKYLVNFIKRGNVFRKEQYTMKTLIYFLMLTLTITVFSHSGYTEPVVTDGLVSYWTFDQQDIAGGTVKDVWGENDGKIVGDPKVVDGQVGEALEFDGADDYVNLTNLGDFGEKVGASTFEAWVKTSFKKEWTTLFKVLDQGCNMAWAIDVNRSAKAGFPFAEDIVHYYVRQKSAAGCNAIAVEIEFALSDGKWHHIVFGIVDPGKSEVSIYMDGEPQEIIVGDAKKLDTFIPFVEPVYIGAANNRGKVERHFPGVIDEVRIYDRPLTADEVTRNFESKIGLPVQAAEKLPVVWGNLKTAQ